jgi:NarL family two-component system response regulator YdfI
LIRVAVISPAIAIRAGLRILLGETEQIDVVAEAASLEEITGDASMIDVMVWAPASPVDPSRLAIAFNKLGEDASVALLCVYDDAQIAEDLARLPTRAWGVLDSEATQAELIAGVQALSEGLSLVNPSWLRQQLKKRAYSEADDEVVEALTTRETEILQLLALGMTNKQIAARLKISAHTVKFHISAVYTKLGTTNRVETVNLGLKKGLIVL